MTRKAGEPIRLQRDHRARPGRLLRAEEDIRRRLSAGLRDSITHALAALTTNLDLVEQQHALTRNPRARRVLAESCLIARQCFRDARKLTDQVDAPLVTEAGLILALQDHVESFMQRTGIRVDLTSEGTITLPRETDVALFQLVDACLDQLRPPLPGGAVVAVASTLRGVKLVIRPVPIDTAMVWRHWFRHHFGKAIRIRLAALPAPQPLAAAPGRSVVLVLTAAFAAG